MESKTAVQMRRERAGMSQRELADASQLSQQYLCDIEKGRCKPSFNAACKLAEVLYGHGYTLANVKYIMQ